MDSTQSPQKRAVLRKNAKKTAQDFSVPVCVKKALKLYTSVIKQQRKERDLENNSWKKTARLFKAQSDLMANTSKATAMAVASIPKTTAKKVSRKVKKVVQVIME